MSDEITVNEIQDKQVAEIVSLCMQKRAEAKALEEKAKNLKEDANALLAPLMSAYGFQKIRNDSGAVVSIKNTKRGNLDKEALQLAFVSRGVDPDVVTACMEEATTYTEYDSVEYREPKE